ncbi:hypothetical protein Cgig2_028283 [Carnegiea gigantea]|uniref:Uncharacterized protein n=1 Tax=Carnegiea gigantea TaxID=171969 RepID=A0A9Q1JP00_9CARY|nr:hypothetical protein Cgig2_028283 [Carnegiea gigantea]
MEKADSETILHTLQTKLNKSITQARVEKKGGKSHTGCVVSFSQETQNFKHTIVGDVSTEFEEWLAGSLVCTIDEFKDLATLSYAIIHGYGQCTTICALSSIQFILTFPSEAHMEAALNDHGELDLWFSDIKKRMDEILLQIEYAGYRVMVKEIGLAIHAVYHQQHPIRPPHSENIDSNGDVLDGELIKETLDLQSISNSKLEVEELRDTKEDCIHSASRTKTVSFSQYGYSKAVLKLSQHLQALEDVSQPPPPGFENEGINHKNPKKLNHHQILKK